jgi:hypothetical protein
MMVCAFLSLALVAPPDSLRRALVLELMPAVVDTVARVAASQGANPDAGVDVYLLSFTALASSAVGEDLDSGIVARALGRPTGRRTPSDVFRCRPGRDGSRQDCTVSSGLYLQLVGLLVSPLHAEATVVAAWPGPAIAAGERPLGILWIRLQLSRATGRWVMTKEDILGQS